jgi:hypothetical protein
LVYKIQQIIDRWTIVFASYGSPTSRFKIKRTLLQLKDIQRVTLKVTASPVLKIFFGELYNWDRSFGMVGPRDLSGKLESFASIFARGLPEDNNLRDVIVARIFSAVLGNSYINSASDDSSTPDDTTTTSLPTKLSVVSVADAFTPTNLVTLVRKMSLAISSHRHSTAGLWNGQLWVILSDSSSDKRYP